MTHPKPQETLEQRVARAAEAALADQKCVSAIDVLTGIGLLAPTHVEAWRKGRIDFLETMIQGSFKKISSVMSAFRQWAEVNRLHPSEHSYVVRTRTGMRNLQVSESGDPDIEKFYRTHFVSSELSERKRKNLEERLAKPAQRVVFRIVRDSQCSECGVEPPRDSFLAMEAGQPLCLACAKFSNLEFLPA